MLTDYHVHLRPDDEDSPAARYFTADNVDRYREAAAERGIEELGASEHIHRFVQSLDVWTHPWYRHWAGDDVDEYVEFLRSAGLKAGIEADFLPGREDRLANLLDGRDWDYVIGSVHFLRDEAVDFHGYPEWEPWNIWRGADPEKVWVRYFETLGEAPAPGCSTSSPTGSGQGLGQPRASRRRPAALLRGAMDGIADSDVALEVSTSRPAKAGE